MLRKLFTMLAALLLVGAGTAWAQLAAVSVPVSPHGYPAYFEDGTGLRLEICLPPPAGTATADMCIGDGIFVQLDDEGNPVEGNPENPLYVVGESFWWYASSILDMPNDGRAVLTLGLEATFGGAESVVNGGQITFARTRVRVDTPVAGDYKIIHPYGELDFTVSAAELADGIGYTADIGGVNFRDPAAAFAGTLDGGIAPFLTWPDYLDIEGLKVRDPDNPDPDTNVLEQYIADPTVPSIVVGSPTDNNVFRIEGPAGSNLDGNGNDFIETNLFTLMGKVFTGNPNDLVAHVYPDPPDATLFAVGPVNREVSFSTDPAPITPALQPDGLVTGTEHDYPFGYPIWYQEALTEVDEVTLEESLVGGLQLTLCPPMDPMCIGDPIDLTDDAQFDIRSGGEQFWYYLSANIPGNGDAANDRYLVILALEATFGGNEAIVDGGQTAFGRERIRLLFDDENEPAATYRVTHPYGQRILESDPDDLRRIRFTSDIGETNPLDPDNAFVGTLFSGIGPTYLTRHDFDRTLTDPPVDLVREREFVDPNDPDQTVLRDVYYIGDPAVPSPVVGGTFVLDGETEPVDYFRVEKLLSGTVEDGDWEEVAYTDEFIVMGKIYDPLTFADYNLVPVPNAPVAVNDLLTIDLNTNPPFPVTLNVLANDTGDNLIVISSINAANTLGTATINDDGSAVLYTPSNELIEIGGPDTFTYFITDTVSELTSFPATVTINVIAVENVVVNKARLSLNRLRWDLAGDSNKPGSILTIYAGPTATGTPVGTATVADNGKWRLRATSTTNPNVTNITISSSAGAVVTLPLDVR